jgi:D-glycero-alpha-D-manno-heptose-7-phosphate kinase
LEREVIREAVGLQDQMLAAFGGLRALEFYSSDIGNQQLKLSAGYREAFERSMVLAFTGVMRDAHVMAQKQIDNVSRNLIQLRRLADLARDGTRLLHHEISEPWRFLGEMLREAWRLKSSLADGIAAPEVETLMDRGMQLGALGGKLLGAGGGGFVLFMMDPDATPLFRERIGVPTVTFRIDTRGSTTIIDSESEGA